MTVAERLSIYAKRLFRFVVVMAALIGVLATSVALVGPQISDLVSAHRSDHDRLNLKPLAERSYIYDRNGGRLGTMTNRNNPQNRSQVTLDKIPVTVTGSVIATEDANFYRHTGVNIRSILRAADANLQSGQASQGGSTITQQVVKNSLVGNERNLRRKLREAFLAVELEKQMSKDTILEYYLNSVYFGGGAYGVQAASEYYFNKDVGTLNWAEGALLASLISSPNYYNPFNNPDVSLKQRDIVFKRLVATKLLPVKEVPFWSLVPLPTVPNKPVPPNDYFVEEVKQQLLADPRFALGATDIARNRAVYEGGISVYTTYDPAMQAKAKQARDETMPGNKGDGTFDVIDPKTGQPTIGTQAIASVEPSSGAVRVLLGGPGYDKVQFNIALAGRQVGSTMKTFVMATLFEKGYVPSDTVSPGGCTFKFPRTNELIHYAGKGGTITGVTQASSNCAYMALGQVAGIPDVAELANRVGVKSSLYLKDVTGKPTAPPNNLPLGTKEISPLEMASAYATFANDGLRNDPYVIERIVARNGKILYQHQAQPVQVVSVQTARLVTEVLAANVTGGTGTRAAIAGGQVAAGKTGTTDDSTNVWFVGFTPRLATAIWMGAKDGNISMDTNPELRGATGGRFPAATWGRYYSLLYGGLPTLGFFPAQPTRAGKSVGTIPNIVGSSGGSLGSSTRRRTTTANGGTTVTIPGSTPPSTPGTLGPVPPGGN